MDLKELITEGESFLMNVRRSPFGDYIADSKGYAEWGAKSLMFCNHCIRTILRLKDLIFGSKKYVR